MTNLTQLNLREVDIDRAREHAREYGREDQLLVLRDVGGWVCEPIDGPVSVEEGLADLLTDELRRAIDPSGDQDDREIVSLLEDHHLLSDLVSAYEEGAAEAHADADEERLAELDRAGEEGWRVCVYGLPGSQHHRWEVAGPGEVDEIWNSIYQPGPCGPYDCALLTPRQAAECAYQDGTPVYGRTCREIGLT